MGRSEKSGLFFVGSGCKKLLTAGREGRNEKLPFDRRDRFQ
jgi:hypothetical protein